MPDFGGVTKVVDRVADMVKTVEELTQSDVLVGIPRDRSARRDGPIGNAAIAYIHEYGSPAHNIPARPFIHPGVRKIRKQAVAMMNQGARDALLNLGKPVNVAAILNKVGLLARNAVVEAITDPEPPFVPLRPATIRARLRKTAAGRRKLRGLNKVGAAAGWSGAEKGAALSHWAESTVMGDLNIHPLIDTGQLRAAITYVIRRARSITISTP